ncbi:MAG: hypothetical protein ACTSPV_19600, partial [Candidatus Hodarchaeales archaeon]
PLPFTSPVPSFDDFQVSHFLVFLITLTGGVQQFRRNLDKLDLKDCVYEFFGKQIELAEVKINLAMEKINEFKVRKLYLMKAGHFSILEIDSLSNYSKYI